MSRLSLTAAVLVLAATGCRARTDAPTAADGRPVFRLGYIPNVTHAPALWALESGALQRALGDQVVLEAKAFNAGPLIIEALFAKELDAAYVGPNPAINGFQKSHGEALRVIAGATQGGAELIVQPEITSPEQLTGKRIASPQLGNTQDVALRTWLAEQKVSAQVMPVANAATPSLFARRQIAGAWLPEPWASRLVANFGGKVLVDERTRWPDGMFPTAVLVASTSALRQRGELVRRLVAANDQAVQALADPAARALVGRRLARELGKPLPDAVLARAFSELAFSSDPLTGQLAQAARQAKALGFLTSDDLTGLVETRFVAERVAEPTR